MPENGVLPRLERDYYFGVLSKLWLKNQVVVLDNVKLNNLGKKIDRKWPSVHDLFTDSQVQRELRTVRRWSRFNGIRQQSLLEHIVCLPIIISYLLNTINGRLKGSVDEELLIKCCYLHVLPKACLGRELELQAKTDDTNLEEWQAFKKLLVGQTIDKSSKDALKKIYLLRHVFDDKFFNKLKDHSYEDTRLFSEVWNEYEQEAKLFRAVELLDYILYCEEQYVQYGQIEPLQQIVSEHLEAINILAEEIPGFNLIWTKQASDHFGSFATN